MPRCAALVAVVPLVGICFALGCDLSNIFGDELPAEDDSDGDGTRGGDGDTSTGGDTEATADDGPCTVADDDRCLDQDRLRNCDPEAGVISTYDCGQLCGNHANFSCIPAGNGQHGCWCVVPGDAKSLTCTELEICLSRCAQDSDCADACFIRTTLATIRGLGALASCAQLHCADTCSDTPAACSVCVGEAMAGRSGGCVLERTVCDNDESDELKP